MTRLPGRSEATEFEVWGCRGSRSFLPFRSSIGNNTSCYSLLHGPDLVVLDAGRGLAALGWAMARRAALRRVQRVHVLVTHAHLDHWEGLKDAERSEEHTSELQSRRDLVCRLLLEKKNK